MNDREIRAANSRVTACLGRIQTIFDYLNNANQSALEFWDGDSATQFSEIDQDNFGIAQAMLAEIKAMNQDLLETSATFQAWDEQRSEFLRQTDSSVIGR